MPDLEKPSGLPISVEGDKLVSRNELLIVPAPESRNLDQVRPYLLNPKANFKRQAVYDIYRGVALKNDQPLLKKHGLRYDITTIFPGLLGGEFAKTIGHHHAVKPGTHFEYPEIYGVISGTAFFLLERGAETGNAPEAYLIEAVSGDKIVVPPDFGHVTINRGDDPLIIANLFIDNVKSNYEFFKNHHGAAHYVVKKGARLEEKPILEIDEAAIVKNNHYLKFGFIKVVRPREVKELGAVSDKPLYRIFVDAPETFKFLKYPEEFAGLLLPEKLFN